jgi:citrate/tricarballylate utilization protein
MPPLDALISQARTLAGDAHAEANRQLTVCNACRYCEGYCATMQAMARRLDFTRNDVDYLAHLCHNCGACLHACQYAPPHEFAIHIPNALKAVRETSYAEHAWPRALSRAYAQHGVVVSLVLALAIAGFLFAFSWVKTTGAPKDFYAVMSHTAMVGVFLPIFSFALFAIAMGALRFWRGHALAYERTPAREATQAALTMKYLDGGHGEGCPDDSDAPTHARRRFHHFTMYGFLLCFAATSVATLYHYALGRPAPYAWHDLPKLLGIVGGVGLLVGPLGLLVLYLRRNAASARQSFDLAFIMLLFFVSLTGFTLMFARGTMWLPAMLAIHLGFVFAFFATMPYSKFVHGVYRGLALLKFSIERRRPSAFTLKD